MRIVLPGLQPGSNYALELQAKGYDRRVSKWSPRFLIQTISNEDIPNTPTNVTWVSVGDAFHGEWDAVLNDTNGDEIQVNRYEIEMTGQPGSVIAYASVPQITGSPKVTFDLPYEENVAKFIVAKANIAIRVRAVGANGIKSGWTTAVTAGNAAPPAPTGFAGSVNFEYIDLSWNAVTAEDLVGYRVYLSTTGAGGTYNRIYQGNALNYSFPSAMYTTDHHFYVVAYDTFGLESVPSNTVGPLRPKSSFEVDIVPPATPTGLTASITNNPNGIGSYANVSWSQAATDDLQGFNVRWRKTGSADNWFVQTFDKDTTSVMVELPLANQGYSFQVRAFDWMANYSAYTAAVNATAPTNPAPANVGALTSFGGVDSVTFSWAPVADLDIKNYEVTFSTSATFASGNTTFNTGTNTTLNVSGLVTGTTYYARVRAVDYANQTSAAWSPTKSQVTGEFPDPTDTYPPQSSPTPSLMSGIGYLYANWSPVLLNSNGGTQVDPVTYEVHLGTATGFATSAATKVTEVSGTFALIDVLPGTTTPLSYNTNYFVRLVAKDRDGAAAASTTSAAAQVAKAGSSDITTITVDQLVSGSIAGQTFTVGTNGLIQSADYVANTSGWKISRAGIEMWDTNSKVSAASLQGGTISATSAITLGPNANLIVNGGELRSNTYTYPGQSGSTYSYSAAATAGWYLGNDGLVIVDGAVKASTLITGTISGTNTITLSGAGAKIVGTGFELSGSGLTVTSGTVAAAALQIQAGAQNLIPAQYSNYEFPAAFYPTTVGTGNGGGGSASISTAQKWQGTQSLLISQNTTTTANGYIEHRPGYVYPVEPGETYIVSMYVYQAAGAANDTQVMAVIDGVGNGGTYRAPTGGTAGNISIPVINAWTRLSWYFTAGASETGVKIHTRVTDPSTATRSGRLFYFDGVMLEQKMGAVNTPSTYSSGGITEVDGGVIKTGTIISNTTTVVAGNTIPVWSIPMNGSATFANMTVRGLTVVGVSGDAANSGIQSANYNGTVGWKIDASGNAYFASGTFKGDITGASGTFTGNITGSAATVTGTITGNTVQTSAASTYVTRMTSTTFQIVGSDPANPLLDFNTGANTLTIGANAVFKGSLSGVTGTFTGALSGATGTFAGTVAGGTIRTTSTAAGDRIEILQNGGTGTINFYSSSGSNIARIISETGNALLLQNLVGNSYFRVGSSRMSSSGGMDLSGSLSTGAYAIDCGSLEAQGTIKATTIRSRINGVPLDLADGLDISSGGLEVGGVVDFNSLATGGSQQNGNGIRYVQVNAVGVLSSSANAISTRSAKHEINGLSHNYRDILALEPKTFRYNQAPEELRSGFIAEDAEELGLDTWVSYEDSDNPDKVTGFDYIGFISALQLVNREQQRQIDELRALVQQDTA